MSRRLENIVKVGVVSQADYKAGKVRVKIGPEKGDDIIETHWLPWATTRAGLNRTYRAPEVGEQVVLVSPSGNMANAIVHGSIPYDKNPHESDTPDIDKMSYRPEKGKISGVMEFNRKTGVRRWHLNDKGCFRWEVGGEASMIMDSDHIQIRVGTTQIVVNDEKISLYVKGKECSLVMTPTDLTGQVKNNGVLVMKENDISLSLINAKVGIKMAADSFKAMVNTTWVNLTSAVATLFGGSSGIDMTSAGALMTSPTFSGTMGSHGPGEYSNVDYKNDDPAKTLKAPDPNKGVIPSMPTT